MKRLLILFFTGLLVFSFCAPAAASGKSTKLPPRYGGKVFRGRPSRATTRKMVPGEVLVRYRKGAPAPKLGALRQSVDTASSQKLLLPDCELLKLKGTSVEDAVATLKSSPLVECASPNYVRSIDYVPDDPYFGEQWNFEDPVMNGDVNLVLAWDVEKGGNPNVVVAVLDTGVAYRSGDGFTQCPDLATTRFVQGYDFINNDATPDDDNGHGTHVCGTIAQSTNNDLAVAGIAFNCSIMPVKVADKEGLATDAQLIDGIVYAADNGANVINMSLGGTDANPLLEQAVNQAADAGVVICASSGNDNEEAVAYPAAYSQCIAVGATNRSRQRASYSNYGQELDVVAPGGDVPYDAIWQVTFTEEGKPESGFDIVGMMGTSMACPHVAGLAALLKSHNLTWDRTQVTTAIENTCLDLGTTGWDKETGYGLIDAASALGQVQPRPDTVWYLAEGSTNGGFETWVVIANPGDTATTAQLTYMTPVGEVPGPAVTLAPKSRVSINVADTVNNEWSVSTKVTATEPVVVERSMYWDDRLAGHSSTGTTDPSTVWYLAEGCTNGGFETWVTVQNPGSAATTVQFTYMTPDGPVSGPRIMMAPRSRQNIFVADTVPNEWSVSTKVTADTPVIAERSVYWDDRYGGHESIGAVSPSTLWFLAGGSCSDGFETWVLAMNPGDADADVQITYITETDILPGPELTLKPGTRQSISIADTLPDEYMVSTIVGSDKPIIVERSVYWDDRIEGHDSLAATTPAKAWCLDEGCTNEGFETFVFILNPDIEDTAKVQLTYMTPEGEITGPSIDLAPLTRVNIAVSDTVPNQWSVSLKVVSDVPVVAERSMYWNERTAGSNSMGVPL